MKQYISRMEGLLPEYDRLDQKTLQYVISKYGTFVELLSFWSVMGYAYFWVKSDAGKEALVDKLNCEGKDSHQTMLNHFLESCGALPELQCQRVIRNALKPSWKVLQQSSQKDSAFAHIVFLTLAENTSLAFIPRLEKAAQKVGCTDFTYTKMHGEADIKHAQLFEKAFYEEKTLSGLSDSEVDDIIDVYFDLMNIVFDPNI